MKGKSHELQFLAFWLQSSDAEYHHDWTTQAYQIEQVLEEHEEKQDAHICDRKHCVRAKGADGITPS